MFICVIDSGDGGAYFYDVSVDKRKDISEQVEDFLYHKGHDSNCYNWSETKSISFTPNTLSEIIPTQKKIVQKNLNGQRDLFLNEVLGVISLEPTESFYLTIEDQVKKEFENQPQNPTEIAINIAERMTREQITQNISKLANLKLR